MHYCIVALFIWRILHQSNTHSLTRLLIHHIAFEAQIYKEASAYEHDYFQLFQLQGGGEVGVGAGGEVG